MSGTTNLADLPTGPSTNQPVQLETQEKNIIVSNEANELAKQREKETTDMNALVSGIQEANINGNLSLPTRDIPQQQTHITQDEQSQANFIPNVATDYISEQPSTDDIIKQEALRQKAIKNSDTIFDELQVPIIIGILYFAFQTPKIKEIAIQKFPSLFVNDGNINTLGSILFSIFFAGSYFALNKGIEYLSE